MTTPEESAPLQSVGERYVLVEQLSASERHETWRGHDDHAGRQVVITRFHDVTDEWRTGFERRARQLEALSDPGIASVLAHDTHDQPPWIAVAYVDGITVTAMRAEDDLTADDALAVIGQTAFALAAAHGVGIGHGALDGDHVQVRPDGSVALLGFAMTATAPAPRADLAALARLAHELLDHAAGADTDIADLLRLLDAGDWDDPGDIGRTTLALAAAARAGANLPIRPEPAAADSADDDAVTDPRRPWYDETERKRVRNRLIALGAIVVLGGAVLLRIFSAGAGHTAVPDVVGIPYVEAQHDLNEVGLRGSETITTGPTGTEGTVIAQDPVSGQQAKVGSVVRLTVSALGPG
ncbi:MAG TPA: PASTA domain-containing protein [Mycobacteriales bacterium]|nr:PASTA domain-containing protein [Mycobacteriales bacterium]